MPKINPTPRYMENEITELNQKLRKAQIGAEMFEKRCEINDLSSDYWYKKAMDARKMRDRLLATAHRFLYCMDKGLYPDDEKQPELEMLLAEAEAQKAKEVQV